MRNPICRMINLAVALIITAAAAGAAVPITVQGSIKAPGGTPVTGTHSLVFRIYPAATGGTQLWTETHAAVPFSNGIYSAVLGNTAPLDGIFGDGLQRWLSVSLDAGTEFNPRQQITATAYAHHANQAATAPIVYGGSTPFVSNGDYVPINGGETSVNESRVQTPAIRNMTITQLLISLPPGTSNFSYYYLTLRVNGVATPLSVAVSPLYAQFAVSTIAVNVLQGDRMSLQFSGGPTSNGISYSMQAE